MTRHTQFYLDYLQSDAWRMLREAIIDERGYTCEECGVAYGLQLHHLTYDRLGHELHEDMQLLCKSCHETADEARGEAARHNAALETYTAKKYGEQADPADYEEEFEDWLERKREDY